MTKSHGMDIGNLIRSERRLRGMTMKQVCDRSGISMTYLSQIERGERPYPSFNVMCLLSDAMSLSLDKVKSGVIYGER